MQVPFPFRVTTSGLVGPTQEAGHIRMHYLHEWSGGVVCSAITCTNLRLQMKKFDSSSCLLVADLHPRRENLMDIITGDASHELDAGATQDEGVRVEASLHSEDVRLECR